MTNQEKIFTEVRKFNFPVTLANLIAAQGAHETGNFTSGVFLDCKNAFGYKSINYNTSCSLHPAYKKYDTIEQSADEIVNWIRRRQNEGVFPSDLNLIRTPSDYAYYLKAGSYFEDSTANYTAGITKYLNYFSPSANTGLMLAGFGVLVLLLHRKKK